MSQFALNRRVNSMKTALIAEKLAILAGFKFSYGPADEWPVYESDSFTQEDVDLLKSFNIPVEINPEELNQRDDRRDGRFHTDSQERYDTAIEDVLGLYFSGYEDIVLFPRIIEVCANGLGISYDALYNVVLAHETAHAITHRCIAPNSYVWNAFASASSESKELLAQLIPCVYFDSQKLNDEAEAMEKLSQHQRPKYTQYKSHVPLISNKNALSKLVLHTRKEEEKKAKSAPHFKPEWEVKYHIEGQRQYSIRDTGIVFSVDDGGDMFDATERKTECGRVSARTLGAIKAQVDLVNSLAIVEIDLSKRGRRGPKTSIEFRVDYGEFHECRSKCGDWGGYDSYFVEMERLIQIALSEAL